jgi:iron complex outermembrane recepter protein
MPSRRIVLTLAALVSQMAWVPGLALAQAPPAEEAKPSTPATEPPATPAPEAPATAAPEAPATAAPPAEAAPATSAPAPAGATEEVQAPPSETAPAAAPAEEVAGAPSSAKQKFGEEIVVTGSRIRRKDLTTPAPVTVLSREQVQASGKVSIGDFLQGLPEQGNAINTNVNNGGDGSTRVSLRSLGDQRTLVLLNGRRFVPGGTGADPSVDLNSIPTAAIERIEVLKDGASALYGSDAIGGVVNIITRKRFNGTEVGGYTGTSTHGDGTIYDVNATTGAAGERGSIMFSAGYFKQNSIFAGDRDFSKNPLNFDATGLNSPDGKVGAFTFGSGTVPAGTVSVAQGESGGNSLWTQVAGANPQPGDKFIRVDAFPASDPRGWRRYSGKNDTFNFQPDNYLVTPQQRISLFSTGDYRLGSSSRGYFEASYVNRQSDQRIAPEPLVSTNAGSGVTLSKDSIYNPFGRDFSVFQKRLLDFGPRQFHQDIDTFRVVGGFDGTLPDTLGPLSGWFWDMSLNYGRTQGTNLTQGDLRVPNIQNAVGPSMLDSTGNPICVRTPGDASTAIPGCVPLDLFHVAGPITPDQQSALGFTGTERGTNQLIAVQLNTSGDLFRLYADRSVALALGYEYRNVQGEALQDPITDAGENSDQNIRSTRGGYHVNEGYAELSVPVVSHIPYVEDFEASAAVRVFDYSNFGSDYTYKFGGRWSIFRDVTLRGTYSTAFRAPSVNDLFLGQQENFAPVKDPCAGAGAPSSCGAAAGNGDDQTQLKSLVGGNTKLQPETAKIYTLGIVLEPRWVKNLTATVDYYHVAIDSSISTIGESTILAACYPADGPDGKPVKPPRFCEDVVRNPSTNRITNLINLNQNIGKEATAGIDIALRYAVPTPRYGRFGFVFDGTWLQFHNILLADGSILSGRGNFDLNSQFNGGTQGVNPAWKFNAGVNWGLKNFGAGLTTKFIGSFKECGDANDPTGLFSGSGLCFVDNRFQRKIDAYAQIDVFLAYTLFSPAGRTNIGVGVNNLFDRAPPFIFTNGQLTGNTDGTAYDPTGRFVYVRLTHAL